MLNLIDEFTHECLAIRVDRKLKSADVIDVLSDQFILRGVPERRCHGNLFLLIITHPPAKAAVCDSNRLALRSERVEQPLLARCDNALGRLPCPTRLPRALSSLARRAMGRRLPKWIGPMGGTPAARIPRLSSRRERMERATKKGREGGSSCIWPAPRPPAPLHAS